MPSSYSPLLRFEEIGAGEQAGLWGDTTNKNLGDLVEQAIAGVTTVSLSGGAGSYTLSALNGAVDESRGAVLKFIGNPSGAKNIIIPTSTKLYVVRNECGQTIVVKTSAQIGGVTILTGEATLVFCDGTSAVAGIATVGVGPTTVANGGTGTTGFGAGGFIKSSGTTNALTASAAVNLATEVTGTLSIANGGTAASSFTNGSLLLGNGTSPISPLVGTSLGQVATWDGTQWVAAATASTIPVGVITMWSGSIATIPFGWLLCNGSNGTPDLRNRFIVGAGNSYNVGATGGSADAALVSHTHSFSGSGSGSGSATTSSSLGSHSHTYSNTTGSSLGSHSHTYSNTTGSTLGTHTHTYSAGTSTAGAHVHTITDPSHTHSYASPAPSNAANPPGSSGSQPLAASTTPAFTGISINSAGDHSHTFSGTTASVDLAHTHTSSGTTAGVDLAHTHTVSVSVSTTISGTTGSSGGSGSGANLPPYYALAYIMKV